MRDWAKLGTNPDCPSVTFAGFVYPGKTPAWSSAVYLPSMTPPAPRPRELVLKLLLKIVIHDVSRKTKLDKAYGIRLVPTKPVHPGNACVKSTAG
jgi:hypothetical protein